MRRPARLLISCACVLTFATGARASAEVTQPAPSVGTQDVPTQQTAMQRLNFMVGFWAGSGWNLTQTGVRQDFRQTEHVKYQVSGLAISVEGEGRDPADLRRVVDSALAVINFNDVTNQYRWEAFSQGFITVATPVVGDHTFQWSLVTGGPTIRYSLQFTATTWHEIGEVSTDGGQTWHQNFQMDLYRLH
jgi:hypothetical protein